MIPLDLTLKLSGTILIADGVFSMILADDLRLLWQLARLLRIIIGILVLGAGMSL